MADSTSSSSVFDRARVGEAREKVDVYLHIPTSALVKILAIIGIALVVGSALSQLASLAIQLLVAAFFAVALDSLVRRLRNRGMGRNKAIAVVVLGLVAVLMLMIATFVPPVVESGDRLVKETPELIEQTMEHELYQKADEQFHFSGQLAEHAEDLAAQAPDQIGSMAGTIGGGVFNFITFIFLLTFLMLSGPDVMKSTVRMIPLLQEPQWWEVMRGAYRNIGAYVVGAISIAFIAGLSVTVLLAILGLPYALPLGLWMFLLAMIPLIGATIGAIPAIIVAFASGGVMQGLIVLVFVIVYQQIENVIIQPRVQGKMSSLSSLVIFLSVLIGSQLLGIVGALIAVPAASIVAIVMRQYLEVQGRLDMHVPSIMEDHDAEPNGSDDPPDPDAEPAPA